MAKTPADRVHARIIRIPVLIVFTGVTRVLLGLAFLPSGLVKALGHRFTTLPVTDPVGYFFDGFFSAHGYYRFVGFVQLTAALLLVLPWTSHLGAALYLVIATNIFAITLSIGAPFAFTRVIAGLLFLGSLYLLYWDYERWRPLLVMRANRRDLGLLPTIGFAGSALLGLTSVTRLHLAHLRGQGMTQPALLVLAAAVSAMLLTWLSLRQAVAATRADADAPITYRDQTLR